MAPKIQPQDFKGQESSLTLSPIALSPSHAGFLGCSTAQRSSDEQQAIDQVLQEILQNPVLMERLCDRVFDLLESDFKYQRERSGGAGKRI